MPSRDYYLRGRDDRQLMAYQTYAIKVAITLGADEQTAEREITDVVDFEILLANVSKNQPFVISICIYHLPS